MKLILIFFSTFIVLTSLVGFLIIKTLANTYSPLDFSNDYNNFEAIVGFDDENGRYITYHYEFK